MKKGSRKKTRKPLNKTTTENQRKQNPTLRKKKVNKKRTKRGLKIKKFLAELALTLFIFSLFSFIGSQFLFDIPRANGYAMAPTLNDGTQTIVYRKGKIKRFSLVYFEVPERNDHLKNIRRVIGLPGERVEYVDDTLYVNREEKVERFLGLQLAKAKQEGYQLTEDFSIGEILDKGTETIPKGYYLVLGDNRTFSVDSRSYGLVPEKNIIGTIEMIF